MIKFLIKYWAQVTGFLTVLGLILIWCWRLAINVGDMLTEQAQIKHDVVTLKQTVNDHDEQLDDQNVQLKILNKIEELREKGLLK